MPAQHYMADLIESWRDVNGLIKPKAIMQDSDNGVLFTSIPQIMYGLPFMQDVVEKCYQKPGLLSRRPNDSSSLEAYDDYLGRAVSSIYTGGTAEPRQILRHFVTHLGFMNNTDSFTFNAWLGRAVSTWVIMFAAAFPGLKWLTWPFLTVYCKLFNPADANDGNGVQLQWLHVMAHRGLFGDAVYNEWYGKFKNNTGAVLSVPFTSYYEATHPIVEMIKECYD